MFDKLKQNPRVLIAVGMAVVIVGLIAMNNDDSQKQTTQENNASSAESVTKEGTTTLPAESTTPVTTTESGVQVIQSSSSFETVVSRGDSQTKIVRAMIAVYSQKNNKQLTPEQRVYAETVIVDALPRDELIHPGETISVSLEQLQKTVDAASQLNNAQQTTWARYI